MKQDAFWRAICGKAQGRLGNPILSCQFAELSPTMEDGMHVFNLSNFILNAIYHRTRGGSQPSIEENMSKDSQSLPDWQNRCHEGRPRKLERMTIKGELDCEVNRMVVSASGRLQLTTTLVVS